MAVVAGAVDYTEDTGKAVDELPEWSFLDLLVKPWMIAVYVLVGLVVLVSSVLLWKNAKR